LDVFDVSNPTHPQRLGGNGSFSNAPFSAHAVFVTGPFVYVASYRGLEILHPFTPLTGPALSFAPLQVGQDSVRVQLQGLPGLPVELERSADLRHWQTWTNGVLGSVPFEFTDPDANSHQFYRALARRREPPENDSTSR
jgi:hypothetical protein